MAVLWDSTENQSHIIRLLKAVMYTLGWPFDWGFLILRAKLYRLNEVPEKRMNFVINENYT